MNVTLKNGKHYSITLRAWDGANCMPDWLEHCPTCQEVSLDMQEVQG